MEDPLSSFGVSVLPSSSSFRLWVLGVVALISGVLMVAMPSGAEACSLPPSLSVSNLEAETPDCVLLMGHDAYGDSSHVSNISVGIENECDEPIEMDVVECDGCQERIVVYPQGELPEEYQNDSNDTSQNGDASDSDQSGDGDTGYDTHVESPATLVVDEDVPGEEFPEGETRDYHYDWQIGDQEGTYVAEATYHGDRSDFCNPGFCSAARDSPPSSFIIVLALFGLAALGRRVDGSGEAEA